MKSAYLKYTLPMALATLLVNAEELSFIKNLPLDKKTIIINEKLFPSYDHRVGLGSNMLGIGGGVTYDRIKTNSGYFGIGTGFFSRGSAVTAMGGYNFLLSSKDVLTPAVGLCYFIGNNYEIFPIVGLGYEHAFNSTFSLGATATSMMSGDFNYIVSRAGIPFTVHFGNHKRWEVRLAPSLLHIEDLGLSSIRPALQASLGYRF